MSFIKKIINKMFARSGRVRQRNQGTSHTTEILFLNDLFVEDGGDKDVVKNITEELSNPKYQKEVLRVIGRLYLNGSISTKRSIFEKLIGPLNKIDFLSSSLEDIFDLIHHFLFSFLIFSLPQRKHLILLVRKYITIVSHKYLLSSERMALLVKVYFGVQYIAEKESDFRNRSLATSAFELLLANVEEEIRYLQTTFYFDNSENFLKMSLKYNNEVIFDSRESHISRFYFRFIARTITQNDSSRSKVLSWAQGNLLSVFSSIKKEKLPVVAKGEYVLALCHIIMTRGDEDNFLFALHNLKRISAMSEKCRFMIANFFEKRSIDIFRVCGMVEESMLDDLDDMDTKFTLYVLKNNLIGENLTYKLSLKLSHKLYDLKITTKTYTKYNQYLY